jgi:hypothetical protein
MDIEILLSRLDKVRSNGNGKWLALCPAHPDKSPSLAIKQTEDGKLLMHCFSGCHVTDIVEALGLNLSDLFPDNTNFNYQKSARPPKFSRAEMFERVIFEAIILSLATRQLLNGDTLEINDLKRVLEAEDLINDIARETRQ